LLPLKAPQAYLLAVVATLATLVLRLALDAQLDSQPTLVMFTVPIMLSGYLGGLRAGLLATAVSCLCAGYFLLVPLRSFEVATTAERLQLAFIVVAGVVISALNEAVHSARRRAEGASSKRLQTEASLFAANALQRAIFNSATFSSIATDTTGVIQIFNVGAERMLGYTAAEVTNSMTAAELHDPEELMARAAALSVEVGSPIAPGFEALVFKASRGIEDAYELTKIRRDGSRFPATVSITALRDPDEAIIGYLLIGTDNTARKQAEEGLYKAGALQRAIFASANFSSIATDASGVIQIFNVGAERMLGYAAVDVVNKITPAAISDREELLARAASLSLELGTPIAPGFEALVFKASRGIEDIYELTYIRKDGSRFPAVVSVTALRDAQDAIIGYLLIGTDNTARQQVEEERQRLEQALQLNNIELVAASRMKSEFLANMSHELRTPLNAIIGFSEVLRDGLLGQMTEQQRKFIGDIFSSGNHLLALINDILDLSKVEAGKMTLDLESVDVAVLLTNSLAVVREKAAARQIRLNLDVTDAHGWIAVDARKVKQIVYNLLSNAVKFTTAGGQVTLRASRVAADQVGRLSGTKPSRSFPLALGGFEAFLEVRVTDTGIGIVENGLERLFTPFSQVDSGLARQFEGTGLGLAMVKSLAELHGGTVAVESGDGEGACFVVWLPIRNIEAGLRPAAEEQPRATKGRASGDRVALVVEGDYNSANLIRLQLEMEGFTVLHAASAEAALTAAVGQPLSLITLDIRLPSMDGWEFLGRIKQIPDLQRVPVVIVSIAAETNKGFALGAAAVMQKPMSRQDLRHALLDLGVCPRGPGGKLSVLVVDDDRHAVEIVAACVAGLATTILRAYGGREAIDVARRERPDVIVLDLMMPEVTGFDVVEALRETPETALIPILVVTAKEITTEDRAQLSDCVTAILEKTDFNGPRFVVEVRRAMSGRQVSV
jgi:signal transduction histidine kinase/CheY-like chemotaxis protein